MLLHPGSSIPYGAPQDANSMSSKQLSRNLSLSLSLSLNEGAPGPSFHIFLFLVNLVLCLEVMTETSS